MIILSFPKSTVFLLVFAVMACAQKQEKSMASASKDLVGANKQVVVAANRTDQYLSILRHKKIGVVANQTSVIFSMPQSTSENQQTHTHLIDSLLSLDIVIERIFSPEHGFRGRADAGELVKDGMDTKTGLHITSLHGKNKKPTQEQLEGLEIVLFDIQDVGVRFYTYIATLQLVMEACAEKGIPIVVLDRPNPNIHYVDGPTMKAEHTSFLGMNEIPLVYGMTIGEYAQMVNDQGWLSDEKKADLTVIPLENYTRQTSYSLPIRPSPNLPNAAAINLYPSLGLFEGTTINAGRGTEFQFQRYGASFLDSTAFSLRYTPQPNFGSKYPKEKGKTCYGEDLSEMGYLNGVFLKWLIKAYQNSNDQQNFFKTSSFTKHAGTAQLQQQIEAGLSEADIKASWQKDLEAFEKIRKNYLIYE